MPGWSSNPMRHEQEARTWQLAWNSKSKYSVALFGSGLLLAAAWLLVLVSKTFEPSVSQILRALATAVSAPILLVWFHNREKLTGRLRNLSQLTVAGIIAAFAAGSGIVIVLNIINPPVFDFLGFWLNGQVAIRG